MIETPTATAIIRTAPENSDEPDAPLLGNDEKAPLEQELLIVKAKPLTAKFKTIIKHLKSRAGWTSRFRGLAIYIIYSILYHILSSGYKSWFGSSLLARAGVHVFASLMLCRLSLLWTHVVISEPSSKRFYHRFVDTSVAKKIILPTIMVALAEQSVVLIPASLYSAFGLESYVTGRLGPFIALTGSAQTAIVLELLTVGAIGLAAFFVILVPAYVGFVRVQASLLAEEEESIVPFDRTYGGKVVPAIVGGSGRLSLGEGWKTFDWNSRVNLFKIYAKVEAMQLALGVVWTGLVLLELRVATGKQMDDMIARAMQH